MSVVIEEIVIDRPCDMHTHLRDDWRTSISLAASSIYEWIVPMPNTARPIRTDVDLTWYKSFVEERCPPGWDTQFYWSGKLTDQATPEVIGGLAGAGASLIKEFPVGTTTGADTGVSDPRILLDRGTYHAIRDHDLVWSVHPADPQTEIPWEREPNYIPNLELVLREVPGIRLVVEHVSTKAMLDWLGWLDHHQNVAATVTPHHLRYTFTDIYPRASLHVQPVCAFLPDLVALNTAVTSSNTRIGMVPLVAVTDRALHGDDAKKGSKIPDGIFTSGEEALSDLVTRFEETGHPDWPERLNRFLSGNARMVYRLPVSSQKITLIREDWVASAGTITSDGHQITSAVSGETMHWRIVQG